MSILNTNPVYVAPNASLVSQLLPIGTMLPYAGENAPPLFLVCEGQEVSRTDYADLFAAIGTAYGNGDGTNTFTLPDPRDRVMRGWGFSYPLGTTGGADTVALTAANMAAHSHLQWYGGKVNVVSSGTTGVAGDIPNINTQLTSSGIHDTTGAGVTPSQPFSVANSYIVVNYIIRAL